MCFCGLVRGLEPGLVLDPGPFFDSDDQRVQVVYCGSDIEMEDRIAVLVDPAIIVIDDVSTELRFLDLGVLFEEMFATDRPIMTVEGPDGIVEVGEDHGEEDVEAGLGRELVGTALELDQRDFGLLLFLLLDRMVVV